MYDNNNRNGNKPELAFSATICLTGGKKDKQGNPTGIPMGFVDAASGCVIIPINNNPNIYYNQKDGQAYLDLNIYENKNKSYDKTHFIRPSVGKRGQNLSEEQKRQFTPIIGNMKPFVAKQPQQNGFGPQVGYGAPQGAFGGPQFQPQGGYAPQAPQGGFAPMGGGYPQGGYAPQPGFAPQMQGGYAPQPGVQQPTYQGMQQAQQMGQQMPPAQVYQQGPGPAAQVAPAPAPVPSPAPAPAPVFDPYAGAPQPAAPAAPAPAAEQAPVGDMPAGF